MMNVSNWGILIVKKDFQLAHYYSIMEWKL